MFKNYIKIVFRDLLKDKFYATITLAGLGIGMTACFFILHFVSYEHSYDKFHEKADRIFRIVHEYSEHGEIRSTAARTAAAVGPALQADFEEVEDFVKFLGWFGNNKFTYGDVTYLENKIVFVNPSFFNVFSIPVLKGDEQSGLTGPDKVMISQSIAAKYFGAQDPLNKELILEDGGNKLALSVTGVYKDLPPNSHFKFDFLISFDTFVKLKGPDALTSWQWTNFYTYILLKPGAHIEAVRTKIPKFIERHLGYLKVHDVAIDFKLQPLNDIHLHSHLEYELAETGSGKTLKFLIIIALFILFIAVVNYVNLSTAKALKRAKEVGVRKVMGADRKKLMIQFLVESFVTNALAMVISLALFLGLFQFFAGLTGNPQMHIQFTDYRFWLIVFGLFLIGSLMSGLYPSLVLSSFKPISVLKGKISHANHGVLLRKGLVTFQFSIAIILISGTLVVYHQITHMLNADLGADIEQTIVVHSPIVKEDSFNHQVDFFTNTLSGYPSIKSITASETVPGQRGLKGRMAKVGNSSTENTLIELAEVDYEFIPSYGIQLIKGRNFDVNRPSDKEAVILSLKACKLLGFSNAEEALNQEIIFPGPPDEPVKTQKVIGITEDYHQNSILTEVLPIIFVLKTDGSRYFSVKVAGNNINETVAALQLTWDEAFPGNILNYFFLDDAFNQQYSAQLKFEKIFKIFSVLSIFIACMGLFGLSAFTADQKATEIGIRKVVGASVKSILFLLSKIYLKLLLVSFIIASPLSFYFFSNWLNGFSYRIAMQWWMIAMPCLIVLFIAIVSTGFYTLKAALINSVKFLRSE